MGRMGPRGPIEVRTVWGGQGWPRRSGAGSSYSNVGSLLTYTIKRTALGLTSNNDQTIYFDIYSSGSNYRDWETTLL